MKNIVMLVITLMLLTTLSGINRICPDTGETIPEFVVSDSYSNEMPDYSPQEGRDVNSWSGTGPWGGNVRYLTTDPSNNQLVFAACGSSLTAVEGGVYFSSDGGINWQPTTLPRKAYNAVAASVSQPGTFYAGARNGLYKTTDFGVTWNAFGQTSSYILGLGVQANNGNVIVMGKSSNTGFLVSTDGGSTFNAVGVNSGFMRMFTYCSANPQRMFVVMGSSTSSVLSSIDNGQTWSAWGPAGDGWGMFISPTDSLFALIAHANGIYRTTDGGANWTNVSTGTFRSVTEYNGIYYATNNAGGIYESNDQGLTWLVSNPPVVQSTWQSATSTGSGALLGHWGGIFRATAYQQPVVASHTGLNLALVHGLAYYSDTNELWGGTEGSGIYKSSDNGATWQQSVNGLGNWMIYELQPTNHLFYQSGRMLAGTLDGVYTSLDNGNTWSYVHYQGSQVSACEVHPTNPDIFWIGSATGEIKYTTDGGQSFNLSGGGFFGFAPRLKLGKGPTGNLRLFLCFQGSATAIWYSDDLGVNFQPSTGMEGTTYQPMVAVRPIIGDQPQIIYASSNAGVYKSVDNGATYSLTSMTGFSWSVLSGYSQQVVSGKDNGVSYSMDEGVTSSSLTQNLESGANIWQIVWGSSTNQLFIALRTRGVMENRFSNDVYLSPNGLTAIPANQSIILNWTPVTGDILPVSYLIWRDAYPLISIAASETSYTDTGLINGQQYKYCITAVYDNQVQTSPTEIITAIPTIPENPPVQNLTATVDNGTIHLSWDCSGPNLIGFNVYRQSVLIAHIIDPVIRYYTDTNLPAGEYLYAVTALYLTGESAAVSLTVIVPVANEDLTAPILVTGLHSNYPNPFKQSTSINYSIKENTPVTIEIYSLKGQLIRTLLKENKAPGAYSIDWDCRDNSRKLVAEGIYFYKMKAGSYSDTKKMILLK
ncbi:MAG: T9SS type A sorting domain-containing protein [Candidatus Cloacimonas sp.]